MPATSPAAGVAPSAFVSPTATPDMWRLLLLHLLLLVYLHFQLFLLQTVDSSQYPAPNDGGSEDWIDCY